jgi:hypothetical protein
MHRAPPMSIVNDRIRCVVERFREQRGELVSGSLEARSSNDQELFFAAALAATCYVTLPKAEAQLDAS